MFFSLISFIDKSAQEKLWGQHTNVTLDIAGTHKTQDLRTENVPFKMKSLNLNEHSIAFAHSSISLGKQQLQQAEAKR